MANEAVKEMFKTSDLNSTDKLYNQKKDCLDEVKRLFTTNLNYTNSHKYYENEQGEDTGIGWNYQAETAFDENVRNNRKFGLYCEPVFLQPHQVAYALEERKALLKWILTQASWMNVPVANPKWINGWVASVDTGEEIFQRIKVSSWDASRYDPNKDHMQSTGKKCCRISVNPFQIVRERDWLFGTNGTPVITMANYREKVRDAQTAEEVRHLKSLLFNPLWDTRDPLFDEYEAKDHEKARQKEKEETNEFLTGVKFYLGSTLCRLADINRAATEYYQREDKRTHAFETIDITGVLERLEKFMDNTVAGREARTGNNTDKKEVREPDSLYLHAGMKWSQWVAYELLKNDQQYLEDKNRWYGSPFPINGLDDTFAKARKKLNEKGITHHWKPLSTEPDLGSVSPPPSPTTQSEAPAPQPTDNSNLTEDTGRGIPVSPTAPLSEEEAQQKLTEVKNKLKTATDELKNKGSQSPKNGKKTLQQLEEQLQQLEDGSDTSPTEITQLKDQIAGLRKQLADIAPILASIQEFFAKNTVVLETVKQYFQKNNVKLIKLAGEEWIIEYNGGTNATIATSTVPELQEIKGFLQSASKKELTSQELSSISNNSSSQTNSPDNKGLYITGAIIIALIVGGAIVFWWWSSKKREKE